MNNKKTITMKKRLCILLLMLIIAVSLIAVNGIGASAEEGGHTHCVCGATHESVGDHTEAAVEHYLELLPESVATIKF